MMPHPILDSVLSLNQSSPAHITNKKQMDSDKNLLPYAGFGYMGKTEILSSFFFSSLLQYVVIYTFVVYSKVAGKPVWKALLL